MITKFVQNVAGCQPNMPHFEAYTLPNRLQYMNFAGYDIISLMEVDAGSLVEVVSRLPYNSVSYFPYNKEAKVFYVVASNVVPYSIGMYWFTENPYDDTVQYSSSGFSKRGCVVACYNIGDRVLVDITVHLPIKPVYQIECIEHLCNLVKGISRNNQCDIVLSGDFNNINNADMLNPLKLQLKYHGGGTTFLGYPNDIGLADGDQKHAFKQAVGHIQDPRKYRRAVAEWIVKNKGQLRSSLDHVFTSSDKVEVIFGTTPVVSNDMFIQAASNGRPLMGSDHVGYIIKYNVARPEAARTFAEKHIGMTKEVRKTSPAQSVRRPT